MIKNVTFTIDKKLLQEARRKALSQNKTLNALFRCWVSEYIGADRIRGALYRDLMKKFAGVRPGRSFTREEISER